MKRKQQGLYVLDQSKMTPELLADLERRNLVAEVAGIGLQATDEGLEELRKLGVLKEASVADVLDSMKQSPEFQKMRESSADRSPEDEVRAVSEYIINKLLELASPIAEYVVMKHMQVGVPVPIRISVPITSIGGIAKVLDAGIAGKKLSEVAEAIVQETIQLVETGMLGGKGAVFSLHDVDGKKDETKKEHVYVAPKTQEVH